MWNYRDVRRSALACACAWAWLGAALALHAPAVRADEDSVSCPAEVPATSKCYSGRDANNAIWLVAIPEKWNRVLVLHAHGGPEIRAPALARSMADLKRWSVMVKDGNAWAGSAFRRGGYGVRMAAEDTENLRQIFIQRFGKPRRTIMHGQSWGGNVGAKVIELYATGADGVANYDGALLTSGVLGGGTRSYDYRMDLRVVYEYYCHNHPRADEPQYPLWQGLPDGSKLSGEEMRRRVGECTGVDLPAEQRSVAQKRNLANILAVTRIPERTLESHMNWATFMFADIVHKRLSDRNPFSTDGVVYKGSDDDRALNEGVARYKPDPRALAELGDDSDLTGKVSIPTLTVHAIDDPTAFVELESVYLDTRKRANTQDLLVQTFTDEHDHSYLSDPEYPALLHALLAWVDSGNKPTAAAIAASCEKLRDSFGAACHFKTGYQPPPFEARVYPRNR